MATPLSVYDVIRSGWAPQPVSAQDAAMAFGARPQAAMAGPQQILPTNTVSTAANSFPGATATSSLAVNPVSATQSAPLNGQARVFMTPGSTGAGTAAARAVPARPSALAQTISNAQANEAATASRWQQFRGVSPDSAPKLGMSGSALRGAGMRSNLGALAKGAGTGAALGFAAGVPLGFAGDKIQSVDAVDDKGLDWNDAGQTLSGAGSAAPLAGALGGAAVALGASGPVGWGIAAALAGGWGIYKAISNADEKGEAERVKTELESMNTNLLTLQRSYGIEDPELAAEMVDIYADRLDSAKPEELAQIQQDIAQGMLVQIQERQVQQQMQAGVQMNKDLALAQQQMATKYLTPLMEANNASTASMAGAVAGMGDPRLSNLYAATANQDSTRMNLAIAQQLMAAPQVAQDREAIIAQLEQQNAQYRLAQQAS